MHKTKFRLLGNFLSWILMTSFLVFAMSVTGQVVQDSSFEIGSPNPYWQDSSQNFSSVICSFGCGTCGGECAPNSGSYYLYMGGCNCAVEEAWIKQDILIPHADEAYLKFFFKIPHYEAFSNSYFSVYLDTNLIWQTHDSIASRYKQEYIEVTIDISSFSDQAVHTLKFFAHQEMINAHYTIFLVDDVSMQLISGLNNQQVALEPVHVFPNPSNGKFTVSFSSIASGDAMEYRIYDQSGKLLIKKNFQPLEQKLEVDLNQYTAGLYHLQIIHKNRVHYAKLLVK